MGESACVQVALAGAQWVVAYLTGVEEALETPETSEMAVIRSQYRDPLREPRSLRCARIRTRKSI